MSTLGRLTTPQAFKCSFSLGGQHFLCDFLYAESSFLIGGLYTTPSLGSTNSYEYFSAKFPLMTRNEHERCSIRSLLSCLSIFNWRMIRASRSLIHILSLVESFMEKYSPSVPLMILDSASATVLPARESVAS